MGDLLQDTRAAIGVFSPDLIVGNHDSITLFGAQAQIKLRDYSKAVSKLFMRSNDELETAIDDVVLEIEKFEAKAVTKKRSFLGFRSRSKELKKEYNQIVAYIERVCLFFQIQQAQLLKEIKLLEKLSVTVGECTVALEHCLATGEKQICNSPTTNTQSVNYHSLNLTDDTENLDTWYARLARKLDDLRVSHTVALQSQAQIKILHDNNLVLLDRIASVISNTFPIWQSQMVMILGIGRLEKRLEDQKKIFSNLSHQESLDVDKIAELNDTLKVALAETASLEKKDLRIRNEFQKSIHYIERG